MKPQIFVGSSVEGLSIAYAVQESLEHDANVTVWTQGIFQLSSTALDDLIKALDTFDFGIFVFIPDDIIKIKGIEYSSVRDNVIFELGLFIGRFGKSKVFFVIPKNTVAFHLPTDLLGITSGKYDDNRTDGNMIASLGPFCNQVRNKISQFKLENLNGFDEEPIHIKKLVATKPKYWEFLLSAALLENRLVIVNKKYKELESGSVFQKGKKLKLEEFINWYGDALFDLGKIIEILKKIFEVELVAAFGEPGIAGDAIEIKYAIDKIISVSNNLLSWEYDLQSIRVGDELDEVIEIMKGWTKIFINEINKYHAIVKNALDPANLSRSNSISVKLTFDGPPNISRISEIFEEYPENVKRRKRDF